MKEWWKWLLSGAGAVILLGFANWIIAQEVSEQMEPIKAEYKTFSMTVSQMQFEDRNNEVVEERDGCLAEHPVDYCNEVAAWRWDVWYPYLECVAPVEVYAEREPRCGPVPLRPALSLPVEPSTGDTPPQ